MIETLDDVRTAAATYGVPVFDATMIAMNACGASSTHDLSRGRMQVRLPDNDETWQVILPLDADWAPFALEADRIVIDREATCEVVELENDDVVLTYLRAGGASLTLNTHSRSTCTGCLFCPNVIEDAADATLRKEEELRELLEWVVADNGWPDLSGVEVITVCTGCFQTPAAAIQHMSAVQSAARAGGFRGRLHLLSSVIRDRADLEQIAAELLPFHLTLTVECFTRRELILKQSKASLTMDDCCRILDDCAELGIDADFTYVVGLDPLDVTVAGLRRLAAHVTAFPRLQVYQAHNEYMRRARTPEAASLEYFLEVRRSVERSYADAEVAPKSWENYRPLWYTDFCGERVTGPRV